MTFQHYVIMWNDGNLEQGPLPLWWQITERLRQAIANGDFVAGDSLPSEAAIIEAFHVSRTTARAALQRLAAESLIKRKAGKGSIVLHCKVDQPATRLSSFGEDMRQRGLAPGYRASSVKSVPPPPEIAEILGETGSALHISRLFLADGVPLAQSSSWLPIKVLKGIAPPHPEELDRGSLYNWLETHCGTRIATGQATVEAAVASARLARALEIRPRSPILVATRTSKDDEGAIVEHAIMSYRADRYRLRVDLARP